MFTYLKKIVLRKDNILNFLNICQSTVYIFLDFCYDHDILIML